MSRNGDSWLFALTAMSAAAVLVSIAGSETLLAIAFLSWVVLRRKRIVWPSYFVPLAAFMATTAVSLAMSPQPEIGMSAVRKFVLFTMGLLAANLVTTTARARIVIAILLGIASITSLYGLFQFRTAYVHYLSTQQLGDDPMVLARIKGTMGHWMTFSGVQLLVWCAAIPAMLILGRRWLVPLGIVGTALVFSFTRSVWLGAIGGLFAIALLMPRRILIASVLPVALVGAAASGLIYHRLSFSFQQKQQFAPDSGRFKLISGGIRMIKAHPLFGVGPERIHTEFPRYYGGTDLPTYYGHLENNIVQLAAERGLVCLAAFLWIIFELYGSFLEMLKTSPPESRWVALSALSALTGFILSGFGSYNFGDSEVLLLLLFIVSLPYGVTQSVRAEEPYARTLVSVQS